MKNSFWTPYISDHTIHAICWTLIHSLWIGLAIALLAGLIILLTRRSSAALRYNLLCGVLALFTLAAGVTFCLEMRSPAIEQGAVHVGQFISGNVKQNFVIVPVEAPRLSFMERTVMFLNEYSNVIFFAWLLFFTLKSLKMAGGLLYIQRIRNYRIHEVSEEFNDKIKAFADQIGIKQAVRLVQSELVKVPVAVGWLKPVILLPVGIILQLSTEQLDSILWHELAHIRRRDYLVNILQGLVETIFFFNPGLLWLSSLIRAEREACCDDMVLSRMNRKANYLEALLAFSYEDNNRMPLAMSIGSGNQLRDRLKRMIDKENKRLSVAEKVVLVAGLVVLSAFTGLPKTAHRAVKSLISVIGRRKDTTSTPKVMLKAVTNKPVLLPKHAAFDTDTTKKPDTSIRFISVLLDKSDADLTNCDMKAKSTDGNIYHFTVFNSELIALSVNDEKVDERQLPEYEFMVKRIRQTIDEKRMVIMKNLDVAKANSPEAKYKIKANFKKRYADSADVKDYYGDIKIRAMKPDSFSKGDAITIRGIKPRYLKSVAMLKRVSDDSLNYAQHRERALRVVADLVTDKVVPNAEVVKWFGLSNTEFIVNGKKQPDEMQQRYKAKYGIHENYGLYYGPVQMTGTGVFINDDARVVHVRQMNAWKDMEDQRKKIMPARIKQPGLWSADSERMAQQRSLFKLDGQQKKFFRPKFSLNDMIAAVTDDLVSENVLKDKGDLTSFKLTNSFLVVNGKQQPEEVHQKLRDKYLASPKYSLNPQSIIDPHFGLQYNAKTGSMGIGISIDRDDPPIK